MGHAKLGLANAAFFAGKVEGNGVGVINLEII
jgi:hypothetical protein